MLKSFSRVAAGQLLALVAIPTVQAQQTVDISKVTCRQFSEYKITNPQNFAVWLSGYYHGKRGDTMVDRPGLAVRYKELRQYCAQNPNAEIMAAVEKLFGTSK